MISSPVGWLRSRGLLASIALVGLLAACMHAGQRAPAAGGTLSLPSEGSAGGEKLQGPLKVVFSSPRGAVGLVTEVSVVFDRPVQPLGVVNASMPFRLTPEVPGTFRWVGSRAAVFTPKERLRFATQYRLEVPAGLTAIDGTKLAQPYVETWETRRPAVLSAAPSDGDEGLPLDTQLRLELNQDVTPAALKAAGKLEAQTASGASRAVPFEVTAGKEPQTLLVKPKQPLPPHATISFSTSEALRGTEGPLGAGKPHSLSFRTYEPLRAELSCHRPAGAGGKCAPESDVALMFNNGVRPREVMAKLRVTPALPLAPPYGAAAEGEEWTTYVPLRGRFAAGGQYRVELEAGVTDQFGQRLLGKVTQAFALEDHYPRVDIGAVGRNFSGPALAVPVASRNVPRYELLTAALTPADLLAWSSRGHGRSSDSDLDWLRKLGQVQVQPVSPRAPKNQIDRLLVDSAKVLSGGRGALAIGARYREQARDYDVPEKMKILNVSDLGISAKLSRFGSLVWVTDRKTNAAVAGAEVLLLVAGRPERKYTTDSDGLAHIPAADFDPQLERGAGAEGGALILARRGADSAFSLVSEHIESWRLDVPSDYRGTLKPYGVAFSDRGIYRPGDEVMLKGIVRVETATGNALPPQKTLELVLRSSSGDEVAKQQVLLTEYGTFAAKLQLPPGAELGSYRAVASGLDHHGFIDTGLEVAEYRPAELKLEVGTDRSAYQRGDAAELELKASYLFGGAASGLSASLSVSRQTTSVEVPGAEEFSTSAESYYAALPEASPAGELRRETRQLDAQGGLKWTEKLDLPGQRGPELLRVDAEVTDVSRRSVAASGSALVHPASFYVGVKADATFVSAPAAVSPQVAAFSVTGQRLAGKRVSLELIERRYTYAREESGDDYRGVSKPIDTVKARCDATTTLATASCALAVPAAGYYLIMARSKDERGRPVEAAGWVYAAGSGEPTWEDNDRRRLELVLDKKSYSVGERARVLVKSPFKEAEALITVERSGVYRTFRQTLRGTAPSFDVAVTKELLPNAFIGVHLLPRRSGKGAVLEPGSYRLGYASLLVSGEGKRLAVAITPDKRDYRPGQNIDVKLSVKDARGAAAAGAEVTLYAADEGVLSLVDYRTPDPLATFSAPRPLQVATLESRDAEGKLLLESLGGGRDKGRDGGGGGDMDVRRDFRQTAYFNPRIVTDARGEAKVSFKLPESLSTYRLMAVAVTRDDRYGFSQQRVTISRPLMARPALPRFLRAGDSFEAGVVVSKKGLPAGKVRVRATFSGVEAAGPAEREVEVAANGSLEVRFAARAPRAGEGSVRFEVTAGSERDGALTPLRVATPMAPEVAAVYGRTNAAQREELGALEQARADYGSLSVALSTTALVGIDQVAQDLLNYPYGCSEQLASRLVPLVALGELGPAVGFVPPADHRARAAAIARELLQRQQGDGGFSMWPESPRSWDATSPYVLLALLRAQQAGVAVPKPALERGRDYLRRLANSSGQGRDLANAAFALDVLAELGAPDAGGVNRLFAERQRLPLFAKAMLLHAAVRSKLGSDVVQELQRDLEAALHLSGDRALVMDDREGRGEVLHSEARTQALVLRALAATGKHALLTELARGLIGARKQGRFRTTHESAWALLALADYRRVAEPEPPRFEALVSLGGERLGGASFAAATTATQRFEVPMARVKSAQAAPLVFEKDGGGQLFYEARLRYARAELPRDALDAGFFVEKSLRAVTVASLQRGVVGATPGVARELAAGDLVLVELTVVAPAEREQMVLDDPLPAGLEAIDPRLSTTAGWLKGVQVAAEPAEPWEERSSAPYDRSEVRDDRVVFFAETLPAGLHHYRYLARATTLGRFVLPPTRVEEMYAPEVFGRTAAAEVTVR